MHIQNAEKLKQGLEAAGMEEGVIDKILYDVEFESTVSALEGRLRGGYEFEEIITDALGTTMDFYDADCAMVVGIDMQLQVAECLYETHREYFMPICGTQPMYLNEYPELSQFIASTKNFSVPDVPALFPSGSKAQRRIQEVGIRSIMAMPYSKRNFGMVAVINPKKHLAHNSMLQILSYVTVAEINEMNLMNVGKTAERDENVLAKNEIYVKLLNGFELQTRDGTITEASIKRKQEILFLTLLLMQRGRAISEDALISLVWDDPAQLVDPYKNLKNLGYKVKRSVVHLFPENGLLQINKTGYAISRKYTITTDLDRFVHKIRDAEGVTDSEKRLKMYLDALEGFHGVVLPNLDNQAIRRIAEMYEQKKISVQNECLSLMHSLGQYERMLDYISMLLISRNRGSALYYWEIKALVGLQKLEQAKLLLDGNREKIAPEQRLELEALFPA